MEVIDKVVPESGDRAGRRIVSDRPVRIVIFAKAPLPGLAKTRLAPALGAEGAARLARRLLQHCVEQALAADIGPVELCVTPVAEDPAWGPGWLPDGIAWSAQGDGDLGARLARASQRVIGNGEAILLIGTDCPDLNAGRLCAAASALQDHDTCLVPVSDGGYALLGLKHHIPCIFTDMPWSTSRVAGLTRDRILANAYTLQQLATLHDIDEPPDLRHLPEELRPG